MPPATKTTVVTNGRRPGYVSATSTSVMKVILFKMIINRKLLTRQVGEPVVLSYTLLNIKMAEILKPIVCMDTSDMCVSTCVLNAIKKKNEKASQETENLAGN
ncbi:unnamed protein product [Lactuca saligna]|uniref:Uncharacterized protein n=1 Tax=Lactuca saligna TaxID=75948 RepID=A0AA35YJG8_LACSI|nr:unnamed protein product [Lactuca saligna]